MKKLIFPLFITLMLPLTYSCGSARFGNYILNEKDAAEAVRQLLSLGARDGATGAFSKDAIMTAIFPDQVKKVVGTLNMLGLATEVDRFTTTLSAAAEKTATASIPIFVEGINSMNLTDAARIIKGSSTAATDYLRNNIGDTLRRAVKPVMQTTLEEYKLNEQWTKLMKPAQSIFGSKFNPNLSYIMSVLVTDAMFRKIEEKETQVRNDATARTTTLLQKVFSRNRN